MDQNQHGRPAEEAGTPAQAYINPHDGSRPTSNSGTGLSASSTYLREQQFAHQYIHRLQQQELQLQLNNFWANQCQETEETTDFKNHSLPLARIKKIMKADEDVRMISAEASVIFARAYEMFILELTMRSWVNAEENKRRTLQKRDIAAAITRTDMFDFLVDIVSRGDIIDNEVFAGTVRGGAPTENVAYYYMPAQHVAGSPYGAPKMIMGRPLAQK